MIFKWPNSHWAFEHVLNMLGGIINYSVNEVIHNLDQIHNWVWFTKLYKSEGPCKAQIEKSKAHYTNIIQAFKSNKFERKYYCHMKKNVNIHNHFLHLLLVSLIFIYDWSPSQRWTSWSSHRRRGTSCASSLVYCTHNHGFFIHGRKDAWFILETITKLTLHRWNTKAIAYCGPRKPSLRAAPLLPGPLPEAQTAPDAGT